MKIIYKNILISIIIIILILIVILGIYYGVIENQNNVRERATLFKTIYTHIDLNAQKVKKMLKDFPIYYINLDRIKVRRDFMEEQVKKYGVKMTRISAVDGLDLDWESGMANEIPYENHYDKSYKMAELACTLSHLYTIKKSYDNGDEVALILEDDIDIGLSALWDKSLKELIKSVPTDWEMINLFYFDIDRKKYNDIFVPLELGKHWGTVAYVINRKGMEKVLTVYNNNKFILQGPKYLMADYFIYSLADFVYIYTKKYLFFIGDFSSTIHNTKTNFTFLGQTLIDDMNEYLSHINFLDLFNIYYINLAHRTDRRKLIEKEFQDINIIRTEGKYLPNYGALGCALSHLKILMNAPNDKHLLIVEDDFTFKGDANAVLTRLIDAVISLEEWNVIMLSSKINKKQPFKPGIVKILEAQTTSGYLVNKKYIPILQKNRQENVQKLIKRGKKINTFDKLAIDQYWKVLQKDNWYALDPLGGYQRKSYSDIEKKTVNYKV